MIKRYELELTDPEAGCEFTVNEQGDLCKWEGVKALQEENARLKGIVNGADSLLNEIFENIPRSFMTGYEWDDQWNEINKAKEAGNAG